MFIKFCTEQCHFVCCFVFEGGGGHFGRVSILDLGRVFTFPCSVVLSGLRNSDEEITKSQRFRACFTVQVRRIEQRMVLDLEDVGMGGSWESWDRKWFRVPR